MTTSDADHEWVSARAVAWVIHDAPVPADLAFTLTVIAARCDEYGRGSYQSAPTIAALTGRSVDQVRRDIRRLLALGLLLLGDQARVEHLPAGQRPTVYDVPLHVRGPKPVKQSKNPSGKKKAPPADGTPGMDATPGMHAGGLDVPAGQGEDDGPTPGMDATPCMDASPGMDALGTPGIHAAPTPGMDATQTTLLNNPLNNPSLSSPERRIMAAVDATAEETREIIEIIKNENRPRSLAPYVTTLAANGDLAALLDRVRAGGRAASSLTPIPPPYAELLKRESCPHGMPGGDLPRPGAGTAACPACRTRDAPARAAPPAAPRADRSAALSRLREHLQAVQPRNRPRPPQPPPAAPDPLPAVQAAHAYLAGRGDFDVWMATARDKLGADADRQEVVLLAAELARRA